MYRRALTVLGSLALLAAVPLSTVAAASTGRATLNGSTPAWANARNRVGAANPSTVVGFRVYLGWTNESAAAALARAVSDPRSARYGKYVTPAQFRQQFAPSQAAVGQVKSWLKSQGFTVDYTPANNHYVSAEGTLAQASAAFGTTFSEYKVAGKTVRSPDHALSIPATLSPTVDAVLGLDESDAFVSLNLQADRNAAPSAGFRNAPPLSEYYGQLSSPYAMPAGFTDIAGNAPWTIRGNTPASIKGAYNISSSYNGAGQTVAIIDAYASPTILSDVNHWSTNRGLPTMTNGQLQQVVPPGVYNRAENKKQDPRGWYSEETLDVEAVHGMAPAARIVYVGAPNNYRDLDAALNHVVDNRLAPIVTNSYGYPLELLPKGYEKPVNDTLIQAAAEGIGVYFSSGDFGDETINFGFSTVDWPPASPWVTAVGGTSLAVGEDNQKVFETGWGVSSYKCNTTTLACTRLGYTGGAGGGYSVLFPRPWYQNGFVNNPGRGVPDVSAVADAQTGYLVGQTQVFPDGVYYDEYRLGGTSLASPIFAGLMALADQKAGFHHGFANPAFYEDASAFSDILDVHTAVARRNFNNSVDASAGTSDFLRTFDDYSGSPAQHVGPGWDDVTGLGTPNGIFP